MFKRKTVLPARPPVPDNSCIVEDLSYAKDNDVVVAFYPDVNIPSLTADSKQLFVSNQPESDVSLDENEDLSNADKSCHKVKKFVEKIEYLESKVDVLKEQRTELLKLKNRLDDIKKDMTCTKKELLETVPNLKT